MNALAPAAVHSGRPARRGPNTQIARNTQPMTMMMAVRMALLPLLPDQEDGNAALVQEANGVQHLLHRRLALLGATNWTPSGTARGKRTPAQIAHHLVHNVLRKSLG